MLNYCLIRFSKHTCFAITQQNPPQRRRSAHCALLRLLLHASEVDGWTCSMINYIRVEWERIRAKLGEGFWSRMRCPDVVWVVVIVAVVVLLCCAVQIWSDLESTESSLLFRCRCCRSPNGEMLLKFKSICSTFIWRTYTHKMSTMLANGLSLRTHKCQKLARAICEAISC